MDDSSSKFPGCSEGPPWSLLRELLREWLRLHSNLATQRDLDKLERLLMTALETLTDAVNRNSAGQAALTTAVNAAIVRLGTPGATDAQLLTLAATVESSTQSDAALTNSLNAALEPPVEPPVETPPV